jgi:hypothetical protein
MRHQIIRQAIEGPMGFMHKIACTCGKQITLTNSLKIAQERADGHLGGVAVEQYNRRHARKTMPLMQQIGKALGIEDDA